MDVALHRCQQYLASLLTLGVAPLLFYIWLQNGHGLLHGACRLHHLWQKHLASAKELADLIHTRHQGSFDDADGLGIFLQGFLQVLLQVVTHPFYQCLLQALVYRFRPRLLLGDGR